MINRSLSVPVYANASANNRKKTKKKSYAFMDQKLDK